MIDEQELYKVACSYIPCPHKNGGNVKGVGLDCCTLPANIIKEITGVDIPIVFGYSGDWYMRHNHEEILLPYLEKYFEQVDSLQPCDLISYRWGRSNYAHLSVYLKHNRVIHCSADKGVEVTEFDNYCFFDGKGRSRITGYWRLKK